MHVLDAQAIEPLNFERGDGTGPLSRILRDKSLHPVFQPIVSLQDGSIYAHEALIRGPKGMPLHTPDALLAAARKEHLLLDFEIACVSPRSNNGRPHASPAVCSSTSVRLPCWRSFATDRRKRCCKPCVSWVFNPGCW